MSRAATIVRIRATIAIRARNRHVILSMWRTIQVMVVVLGLI